MASRESPGLADYVVIALSPLLIMAMVGSLVFFLVDVLYAGQYGGRLQYTMFFFVAGAVLIARIAIELDGSRAALYALALGVVCWLALQRYVEYPAGNGLAAYAGGINLLLMGLVWWSAHKLTWDCTHIDERRRSSGKGILSEAGLGGDTGTSARELKRADAEVVEDVEVVDPRGRISTWRRYQQFRERQRNKPHTPGVWVVYFALAALPLFGLGQSLIPPTDTARRSFSFWLMLIYVGSALGLLVTTSFLGLRRYLRQRGLQMPATMTGLWMLLGAGLISVFLVVGAFLPRPHSETPLIDIQRIASTEKNTSKYAQRGDGASKGEGASGDKSAPGKGNAVAKGGDPGGKGNAEGKDGSGGKGKASGNTGEKANNGKNGNSGNNKGKSNDSAKQDAKDKANDSGNESSSQSDANEEKQREDADTQNRGQSSSTPPASMSPALEKIASVLKWIVFALIVLGVLALLFYRGLSWLANFMPWARRLLESISAWWQSLFGGRSTSTQSEVEQETVRQATRVPFRAYSNPFRDGSARRRELAELVRYSFSALEAWGADQGHARRNEETPLEYVNRLNTAFPDLEQTAHRLVIVYSRLAYATRTVSEAQAVSILETFWQKAEAMEPENVG